MSRLSKPPNNKPVRFSKNVVAGQPVKNKLLLALPKNERAILFPVLAFVPLPVGTKLSEKGASIKFGYFLNDGLASVLNVMQSEKSIEVGLSGKEGFVGLPLTVGFTTSPAQVVMQIGGSGFKISCGRPCERTTSVSKPDHGSCTFLTGDGYPSGSGCCVQSIA